MDETERRDLFRALFDALPSIVLVVDQDARIQEYNAAASDLLTAKRKSVLKQRTGDILHAYIRARCRKDVAGLDFVRTAF